MSHDNGFLKTKRLDKTDHVTGQVKQCVLVNCFRFIGLAITAHVRCDGAVASFCQCLELMPPRIPRFGKSMT